MSTINVFEEYIDFSYKSTKKLMKIIMEKHYIPKIYDEIFDTYKKVRYLNEYKNIKKDFSDNIDYYILKKANLLKEDENYNQNIVNATAYFLNILFIYDIGLLNIEKLIELIESHRKSYLNLETEFKKEFINLQNEISTKKKNYFKQFDSNTYKANYFYTNMKRVYNVSLEYNLKFPKLYSQYAINKVYNSDVVAEDKLFIEYYMVTSKILNEVVDFNFKGDYLLEFETSLFAKKEKLLRLLNIIDSDYIKEKVSFKIYYKEYLNHKDTIQNLINSGYNFSVIIDETFEDNAYDKEYVKTLFKYIIIDVNSTVYNSFSSLDNIIKIR